MTLIAIGAMRVYAAGAAAGAAREVYADSLELLICRAKSVMRARVSEQTNDEYGIEVLEVLKGLPARRYFSYRKYANPFPPRPLADGHEFLLIATGQDDEDDPSQWDIPAAVPLDGVGSLGRGPWRSMDGSVTVGSDQVMAVARAAVSAGTAEGWERPVFVRIPAVEPGQRETVLRIPGDERAKDLGLRWAKAADPKKRLNAARLLGEFPSPESLATLRALLTDDSISVGGGTNLERDIYDVRLAAFLSLRSMSSPNVSEPQIDVTPWPVAFVTDHAMGIAIVAMVLAMPPISFGFHRRWRQRRGRFVERLSIGRAIFGGFALASMALGLVLGYYWLVSHGEGANFARIGEMGWARMANSVAGKLQYAILEGMPQTFTTAHWSSSTIDYEIQMMNSPEIKTKGAAFGFAYARSGSVTVSGPRATFVQAPYWAAVMASALLPAAWMVRQRGLSRRRRRADAGQCLTCGYDLRQTPERCPECGAAALKAGSHFTTLA